MSIAVLFIGVEQGRPFSKSFGVDTYRVVAKCGTLEWGVFWVKRSTVGRGYRQSKYGAS